MSSSDPVLYSFNYQISDALIAVSCKLLWHPNPICQSVILLD